MATSLVVVAAVLAAGVVWPGGASPAGASCAGPTVTVTPAVADRGRVLDIAGEGFGTDCFDTGPPPEGMGALGAPQTGITIEVAQGAERVTIAQGDADDRYRIRAQATVPVALEPGPAQVVARGDGGPLAPPVEIEVSEAAPDEPAGSAPLVAPFLDADGADADAALPDEATADRRAFAGMVLLGVILGAGGTTVLLRRRRDAAR